MKKLLWLDMEMTGLDVSKERVLEVAVIVTDMKLEPLAQYEQVVFQDPELLAAMDDWNQKHHGGSGLLAKVPFGKPEAEVDEDLYQLVKQNFDERPVIAGNSIGQDRLFIDKYFKKFSASLHYRMLDVTSWKLVFENIYQKKFPKQDRHRALDDIQESIDELKFYLSFVKPQ